MFRKCFDSPFSGIQFGFLNIQRFFPNSQRFDLDPPPPPSSSQVPQGVGAVESRIVLAKAHQNCSVEADEIVHLGGSRQNPLCKAQTSCVNKSNPHRFANFRIIAHAASSSEQIPGPKPMPQMLQTFNSPFLPQHSAQ